MRKRTEREKEEAKIEIEKAQTAEYKYNIFDNCTARIQWQTYMNGAIIQMADETDQSIVRYTNTLTHAKQRERRRR